MKIVYVNLEGGLEVWEKISRLVWSISNNVEIESGYQYFSLSTLSPEFFARERLGKL